MDAQRSEWRGLIRSGALVGAAATSLAIVAERTLISRPSAAACRRVSDRTIVASAAAGSGSSRSPEGNCRICADVSGCSGVSVRLLRRFGRSVL
jgi:hypothetical protein